MRLGTAPGGVFGGAYREDLPVAQSGGAELTATPWPVPVPAAAALLRAA
jgi:hypothetical protein